METALSISYKQSVVVSLSIILIVVNMKNKNTFFAPQGLCPSVNGLQSDLMCLNGGYELSSNDT